MSELSNIRPISILAAYMVTAIALTASCIAIIRKKSATLKDAWSRPPALSIAFRAAMCLASTWYYMFCFFRWSYLDWASSQPLRESSTGLQLGQWLHDTSLFRQAWASTVETPLRSWWSLQIFGFCAVWSIVLATQAKKKGIPHPWVFMLLGQIVAISFAANLSFIAFALYDESREDGTKSEQTQATKETRAEPVRSPSLSLNKFWWPLILGINIACAVYIPNSLDSPYFMRLLLVPHVLAFVPMLPTSLQPSHSIQVPSASMQLGIFLVFLAIATAQVVIAGGDLRYFLRTLNEHPAVSSVGWDVICCWVSFIAWFRST